MKIDRDITDEDLQLEEDPFEVVRRTPEEIENFEGLELFRYQYLRVKPEYKDKCICDLAEPLGHVMCLVCNENLGEFI